MTGNDTSRAICGCRVTIYCNQPIEITPCPLHDAAPDMLEALKLARSSLGDNTARWIINLIDDALIKANDERLTSWLCSVCQRDNEPRRLKCKVCGHTKGEKREMP